MRAVFGMTLNSRLCLLIGSEQNQISRLNKGMTESSMDEKLQTIPKVQNLVVARYRNGKIIRGGTHDFGPQKRVFHVSTVERHGRMVNGKIFDISLSELKAVFFSKISRGKTGASLLERIDGRKIRNAWLDEGEDPLF